MFWVVAIAAGAGCFALSVALVGVMMRAALKWGVVSQVTGRSSHTVPTGRLGGVGLIAAYAAALAAALLLVDRLGSPWAHEMAWSAAGLAVVFAVGLADDLWDIPALAKLAGLGVAAWLPVYLGGLQFNMTDAIGFNGSLFLGRPVTLLWLLFFINAFNFMDGMDGFAGSFALMAAGLVAGVVLLAGGGRVDIYWLAIALVPCACAGFLRWNWPPARTFMGDAGSLSLGYLLAWASVAAPRGIFGAKLAAWGVLLILLPFVFDVLLTLARRTRRRENILRAHREHLYQRRMRTGMDHAQVLGLNLGYFAVCGAAGAVVAWWGHPLAAATGWALGLWAMVSYWRGTQALERRGGRVPDIEKSTKNRG